MKAKVVDVEADAKVTDYRRTDWRKLDPPGAAPFAPVHTRAETLGDDTRVPHQCRPPSGGNDHSAGSFADTFFPSAMMRDWAKHSEAYRQHKGPPSMRGTRHRAIDVSDIYHFLSITIYMGVVRLSSVSAYWECKTNDMYPEHKPCRHLTYPRYQVLWRCISMIPVDGYEDDSDTEDDVDSDEEEEEEEDDDDSDTEVEGDGNNLIGRLFYDSDDEDTYIHVVDVGENGNNIVAQDGELWATQYVLDHLVSKRNARRWKKKWLREEARDKRWFRKVAPLLDHIEKVNKELEGGNAESHRDFIMSFSRHFMETGARLFQEEKPNFKQHSSSSSFSSPSVSSTSSVVTDQQRSSAKKAIVSHTNRFDSQKWHQFVKFASLEGEPAIQQKTCVVCNSIRRKQVHDPDVTDYSVPTRCRTGCTGCPGIALCKEHFRRYHLTIIIKKKIYSIHSNFFSYSSLTCFFSA